MRKHFYLSQWLLAILFALIPAITSAHDFDAVNDYGKRIWYNITSDHEVAVTFRGDTYYSYYNEYDYSVYIPESVTYNGVTYSVTSIGNDAFRDCEYLEGIAIPESVTSIGESAFYNCESLEYIVTIYICNVTSIGDYAFYGCRNLREINILESVTSIGNHAFTETALYNNPNKWNDGVLYIDNCLIEAKSEQIPKTYNIQSGTRLIADYAFASCSSMTEITIPNSVTTIGKSAFTGCRGLTSVTIPASVTSIGRSVFSSCRSLTAFYGKFASNDNRCLIIDGELKSFAPADLTSYTIPNSVTKIGEWAFIGCSSLTSITIPNSVTSIGEYVFYGCSSLTSITIPNSVASICDCTFYDCSSLTSVTIPNSVTSIGMYAFYGCSSLTSVTIPNSVTSIGNYAFYGCSSLTSVTIPNSVTSIGRSAFNNCNSLTAFYGKFASDDNRCLIKNGELIYFAPAGLTSYTIPNSVTSIGYNAFGYCTSLTSVTIPNSVTSIGEKAFYSCSSLTSFTIPNSVTSIGMDAFYGCSRLTSVTIPNSVTSIGTDAFDSCSNLTSVTVENPNPTNISLGYSVFLRVPKSTCTLYVPKGSRELYAAAYQWKDFENIVEYEPEGELVMGDLDGDEKVSIADVVIGCNLILSEEYSEAADFNNDGKITIADIVLLCNEILSNAN